MNKGRILITAPAHPILEEKLRSHGYEVFVKPDVSYSELENDLEDVIGLVVTTRITIDRNIIDKAGKLQWIGRLGSGMELIDTAYASQKNIQCISTPEGNRNAVAEHALALTLCLMNKVCSSFAEVKNGKWLRRENSGIELSGKKVGIIGFGNTGSSFARLLEPFNVDVLVYDKYKKDFTNHYIRESSLEEIQSEAKIISLHVPLTAETFHMINDDFFTALKQRPFFITTCRGAVTDSKALISALKNNLVSGAALDVLENEKLSSFSDEEKNEFDFLCMQSNVIITPHIAGYTDEAFLKMATVLLSRLGL